jgi:hypothetical protein
VNITYEEIQKIVTETIKEVLGPNDPVGKWVTDFYKSTAPQFRGKSKKERREMAIAAALGAKKDS